jgi:hypothetical protein
MKKAIIGIVALAAFAVHAEGYIGLEYARSKISTDCVQSADCSQSQKKGAFNLKWGTQLPEAYSLKLDNLSIDTIEFGAFKSGRVDSTGTEYGAYWKNRAQAPTPARTNSPWAVSSDLKAQGVYAAVVGRYALPADISLYGRLGLAYVSTTLNTMRQLQVSPYTSEQSIGSVTEQHLSPWVGLGVEYAVLPGFKLNAGLQMFKIKTSTVSDSTLNTSSAGSEQVKGTVREFVLGGAYNF